MLLVQVQAPGGVLCPVHASSSLLKTKGIVSLVHRLLEFTFLLNLRKKVSFLSKFKNFDLYYSGINPYISPRNDTLQVNLRPFCYRQISRQV